MIPQFADHVIPRAFGGSDHISNLAAAHRSCNGRKGATMPNWTEQSARVSERFQRGVSVALRAAQHGL
jgi:5-methylcytosine-specific restriction endonuclease McrA